MHLARVVGDIVVEDGIISEIAPRVARAVGLQVDGRGCTVLPGMVDTHVHLDACEDLAFPGQNIWQTKMRRTELDPTQYFAPGIDPFSPENRELLELIRREMTGIFYRLPN